MAFLIYILYPRTPGTTFNYDYYTSKHAALATEIWGPYSARTHSVTKMDEASGYHLALVVEWDGKGKYEEAQKDARTKEIVEDIGSGRFTTAAPVFLEGEQLG